MSGQEYYLEGIKQFDNKNYEDALRHFTRALLLEPKKTAYLFAKARTNCQLEKYLEALTNFEEALLYEPHNALIHSEKGVALFHLKRLDEALKCMTIAQEIEPENPYRYASRAYIRAKAGDIFGAVDDYKTAVRLDPTDAVALNNLGMLEEQMGYQKNAKNHFKKADMIAQKYDMNDSFKKVVEEARKNIKPISEEDFEQFYGQKNGKKKDSSQNTDISKTSHLNDINGASKPTIQQLQNQKAKPTFSQYLNVILDVFTSKSGFADFREFVKKLLRGK